MSLKKLNQFLEFDWGKFMAGKEFVCVNVSEWLDYETKKHLGVKVEAAITKDDTHYETKNGEKASNIYEKLTFKVMKDITVPLNARIVPVGVKAKAYGDNGFVTKLSITCDDIQVMQPLQKGQGN